MSASHCRHLGMCWQGPELTYQVRQERQAWLRLTSTPNAPPLFGVKRE